MNITKGEMNHKRFLRNWGIMAGGFVCEIRRLTIQYLFARELYAVKDQYVIDGALVVERFDMGAVFRDSVDPIVKELEYLNAVGGWVLNRFADLNGFSHAEILAPAKSFKGFHGPDNWKRPPQNEVEKRLYIPDFLLAFLVYSSEKLFMKSKSYLAKAKWTQDYHFHPEKLPADKDEQNAVLVLEIVNNFRDAMLQIEFLRTEERN